MHRPCSLVAKFAVAFLLVAGMASSGAEAQSPEIKRFNPSEWTKGRFTEMITVVGPGKTIYLAGVGGEDEKSADGAIPEADRGNVYKQCMYAYDKIKRLLASQGGTLADVVKQTVYVTDIRFQADVARCRREQYGPNGPIPINTFLVINQLAHPYMFLEIDITAIVK